MTPLDVVVIAVFCWFLFSIMVVVVMVYRRPSAPEHELEMVNCGWCGDYAEGSKEAGYCSRCMYYHFPEEMRCKAQAK